MSCLCLWDTAGKSSLLRVIGLNLFYLSSKAQAWWPAGRKVEPQSLQSCGSWRTFPNRSSQRPICRAVWAGCKRENSRLRPQKSHKRQRLWWLMEVPSQREGVAELPGSCNTNDGERQEKLPLFKVFMPTIWEQNKFRPILVFSCIHLENFPSHKLQASWV